MIDLDQLRRDVALANQITCAARLGTAFGHVSALIPGTRTFLFPQRASPTFARPEQLLVLDLNGNVLEGDGQPNSEVWIHIGVYYARPEVGAVVHVHPEACVILGQTGKKFRAYHNSGSFFPVVPLYKKAGLIRTRQLGDEVAQKLGPNRALFLRGHGTVIADTNVKTATIMACFLEEAAGIQLSLLAVTNSRARKKARFTIQESNLLSEQMGSSGPLTRAWDYYAALAEGRISR